MFMYTMPLIGALIGWLTNALAIKMLFRPREEIKILFITIQGVFPRRQQALARQVGRLVAAELISTNELIEHLKEKASSDAALDHIATRLAEALFKKLPQGLPMLTMLLSPDLLARIKATMLDHLRSLIQDLVETLGPTLEKDLDVQAIVEEKVASFSCARLEEIVREIMRKELRFIELTGAVLGFLIGLGQTGLLLLS